MKTNEQIKIVGEKYGKLCAESYQTTVYRLGEYFCEKILNFDRLLKITDKIIQVDILTKDCYLVGFCEAVLYEINLYTDDFTELRKCILKGGLEINRPAIERMMLVGVEVPEDITESIK